MIPLINGVVYDYAKIECTLPGVGIDRYLTEISYSDSVDHGKFRGMAPHALALTDGEYDAEASATIEKQHHANLMKALKILAAPHGGNLLAVRFDIIVMYAKIGMPIITDTIKGCAYGGSENSHSQGNEALVVTMPLACQVILHDGVNPLGAAGKEFGL